MKRKLKIAFCIRSDYISRIGGDTTQLLKTKEYLEKDHNVRVDVVTDPCLIDDAYDLCHIFNITTKAETVQFLDSCKKRNIRSAISSIFWDYNDTVVAERLARIGIYNISHRTIGVMKKAFLLLAKTINKPNIYSSQYREYLHSTLTAVDLILPNSIEELRILSDTTHMEIEYLAKKAAVVVNGITPTTEFMGNEDKCRRKYAALPAEYILEVARIEPGKNQWGLLRAMEKDNNIPIVFIGDQSIAPVYFRKVYSMSQKRGNVLFINRVDHQDINYFYLNAMIHVLPSLAETTGLVSLEALANGCKIVVSQKGYCPYETYFKNYASCLDPLDMKSIRKAIYDEIGKQRDMERIRMTVNHTYTWKIAAQQTYDAYQKIITG